MNYTIWFKTNVGDILDKGEEIQYPEIQVGDVMEIWLEKDATYHLFETDMKIINKDESKITFYCHEIII